MLRQKPGVEPIDSDITSHSEIAESRRSLIFAKSIASRQLAGCARQRSLFTSAMFHHAMGFLLATCHLLPDIWIPSRNVSFFPIPQLVDLALTLGNQVSLNGTVNSAGELWISELNRCVQTLLARARLWNAYDCVDAGGCSGLL